MPRFLLPWLICLSAAPSALLAQAKPDDAWPCEQVLQPALSAAAIWAGPDPEVAMQSWQAMPDVAALTSGIAPRWVELDAAQARIKTFAQGLEPSEKAAKLTALFAGLFQHIDGERSAIILGVGNYHRRQQALAQRIADNWAALDATPKPDAETAQTIRRQLDWDARVFDERQRLLPQMCEQPGLLERRLFALARTITNALPE